MESKKVIVVKPQQRPEVVELDIQKYLDKGKTIEDAEFNCIFDLQEELIGDITEMVPINRKENVHLICDDAGVAKNLQANRIIMLGSTHDMVLGNFILCGFNLKTGQETALDPNIIDKYLEIFDFEHPNVDSSFKNKLEYYGEASDKMKCATRIAVGIGIYERQVFGKIY